MFEGVKNVYFLGIGGIGMSALARWFNANGYTVGGYDKTQTALTRALENEGIEIHYHDSRELIPETFKNKENTLVVITPAVPLSMRELKFFNEEKFVIEKRAKVLGEITKNHYTIAIAGTHGKTTTTTMIAHLLQTAGVNVTAFMGGVSANYNTNLLLGDSSREQIVVVEADEYDRSFLHLNPNIAVITSTDADHLDIYGSEESVLESFGQFIYKIKQGGFLYRHEDTANLSSPEYVRVKKYGPTSIIHALNKYIHNGEQFFDYADENSQITQLNLKVPGYHNLMNIVVAITVAKRMGLTANQIREGVESYLGVKRRFEYVLKTDKVVFIDDYAHHPTEINATLEGIKSIFPNKKITLVFQPHLYSRTRDFMAGFAQALSKVDQLLLLDIYAAREVEIPGVSADILLDKVKMKNKKVVSKSELIDEILASKPQVIITMGAGDIDKELESIKKALLNA